MESGQKSKILIVDHDPKMLRAYSRLLSSSDYDVAEACSGAEALAKAGEWLPDLILLDMVLPDLDGLEVCRQLKAKPHLPGAHIMILSSVRTDGELKAACPEAGAEDCIARPITNKDLLARVRAQLSLKATMDELRCSDELRHPICRRFYKILSSLYAGVLLITEDSRVQFANSSFCDQFNLESSPEELTGLSSAQMLEKIRNAYVDPVSALQRIQEILQCGLPVKGEEITMSDGRTYLRDFIPIEIDGKRYGRLWHHHDITEQKRAETALRESEDKFRMAFENANTGMCLVDLQGKIFQVNNKMSDIFGYSRGELEGMSVNDLALPEDTALSRGFIHQAVQGIGDSVTFEKRYRHQQGHIIHGQVACSLVRDAQGQPRYFISQVQDITERKRAEEALREGQAWLSLALSSAHMGTWYLDLTGGRGYLDKQVCLLLGIDPTTFTGTVEEIFRTVHPEDWKIPKTALALTIEREAPFQAEYRVIWPDGSTRHIAAQGGLVRDVDGQPVRVNGIMWDVTEQKRAEEQRNEDEKLRASEAWLRELADNLRQVLWLADAHRVLYTNDAYEKVFGLKKEDLYRNRDSFRELIHPDDRERVTQALESTRLEALLDQEFRIVRPDGTLRWIRARSFPIWKYGHVARVVGIADDITDRKEAIELLHRENVLRKAIIDQARDGICLCHEVPDYPYVMFTVWNDAMTRITGYNLEEINREGWYRTLYPDHELRERAVERIQRMRTGDDLVAEEWEITHRDGSKRAIRISTSVIHQIEGAPQVLALMQDFTTRKCAEDALRVSQEELRQSREYYRELAQKLITAREEERRRLARELHDDITQRATVLAMQAGILVQRGSDLPGPVAEKVMHFERDAMKLAKDVHSFSRDLHPSIVEDFGIVEAVRSECLKLQQKKKIPVRFHPRAVPGNLPIHQAVCLYRIVQEGLRNIAKHANAASVSVSLIASGDYLHLSIRDKGIGFDPAKARGRKGLGLASMRERVSLVEGTMEVRAESGKGVHIKVRIPLQRVEQ